MKVQTVRQTERQTDSKNSRGLHLYGAHSGLPLECINTHTHTACHTQMQLAICDTKPWDINPYS